MFTDALNAVADFDPALKDAVKNAGDWRINIIWPSVLNREDQAYQQMFINRWNAGTISPESYLEAMGVDDVAHEMDRIMDSMNSPVSAAMMGHALPTLASHTINKSLGIPPQGYLQTKVQLRGELAPQEVGNLGHTYGLDQGPYGDAIGPTGMDGTIAADQYDNANFVNGNVRDGGTANYQGPNGAPAAPPGHPQPMVGTPAGGGQPMSQPGSGAPAVSAQGAINQVNQNQGK
jgi:hypothetical protein